MGDECQIMPGIDGSGEKPSRMRRMFMTAIREDHIRHLLDPAYRHGGLTVAGGGTPAGPGDLAEKKAPAGAQR
jgi:hypothetical protein